MESLEQLITNKGFDKYQSGASARFEADRMTYHYEYINTKGLESIKVDIGKGDIICQIEINIKGELLFQYGTHDSTSVDKFKNCVSDDFHAMLAHAFIYLRDGNFDYHQKWYEELTRA